MRRIKKTAIIKLISNILLLQGFENSNARALVVKGINVLLTLLQVSHATLIWNIDEDNVYDILEQKGMSKI